MRFETSIGKSVPASSVARRSHPTSKRVVTASEDDTARVWNAPPGRLAKLEGHIGSVNSAAFSPDGQRVVTGSDAKECTDYGSYYGYLSLLPFVAKEDVFYR